MHICVVSTPISRVPSVISEVEDDTLPPPSAVIHSLSSPQVVSVDNDHDASPSLQASLAQAPANEVITLKKVPKSYAIECLLCVASFCFAFVSLACGPAV